MNYTYETVISQARTTFSDTLNTIARDDWEVISSGRDAQGYWWAIIRKVEQ